jgi:hypothetical protein
MISLALLLAACGSNNKPEDFTKQFYQTIAAGKIDQAVGMFSYQDVKESDMTTARGKVTMVVGHMQSKIEESGGLKSVEILSVETAGDTQANIEVKLHFNNGSSETDRLRLIREQDGWKIQLK